MSENDGRGWNYENGSDYRQTSLAQTMTLYCGSYTNLLEGTQNFKGGSRSGIFTNLYCSNVDNSKSLIIQSEMLAPKAFFTHLEEN